MEATPSPSKVHQDVARSGVGRRRVKGGRGGGGDRRLSPVGRWVDGSAAPRDQAIRGSSRCATKDSVGCRSESKGGHADNDLRGGLA